MFLGFALLLPLLGHRFIDWVVRKMEVGATMGGGRETLADTARQS